MDPSAATNPQGAIIQGIVLIILLLLFVTIVFKVSDNIKEMMIKHYEDMKCDKTPPYAIFQVKDFDCVTTLYESGKIMFQGFSADIEASFWIEQERIKNNRYINKELESSNKKNIVYGVFDSVQELKTPFFICMFF